MKQIVEKKLNEVRAKLRAMPSAYAAPKTYADRQKLLVAITQQVKCVTQCRRLLNSSVYCPLWAELIFLLFLPFSVLFVQYLRYLTDCIRGEYWDRVLVRHPELRMYNTVVKKFEIFQAQVRRHLLLMRFEGKQRHFLSLFFPSDFWC